MCLPFAQGKGWCLDTWTHQPCSYQGREKSLKDEVTTQAFGKLGSFHTCRQRTGPICTIYLGNLETLTIIGSEFFNPIPPSSPCDPSGSLTKFQFICPLPWHVLTYSLSNSQASHCHYTSFGIYRGVLVLWRQSFWAFKMSGWHLYLRVMICWKMLKHKSEVPLCLPNIFWVLIRCQVLYANYFICFS